MIQKKYKIKSFEGKRIFKHKTEQFKEKIKKLKFFRFLYKMCATSTVVCFLTFFVGAVKNSKVVTVRDNLGFEKQVVLSNNHEKNLKQLELMGDKNKKDEVNVAESDGGVIYNLQIAPDVIGVVCDGVSVAIDGDAKKIGLQESLIDYLQQLNLNVADFDVVSIKIGKRNSSSGDWFVVDATKNLKELLQNSNVHFNECSRIEIKIDKAMELGSLKYAGINIGLDSNSNRIKQSESLTQFFNRTLKIGLTELDQANIQLVDGTWHELQTNVSFFDAVKNLSQQQINFKLPLKIKVDHYVLEEQMKQIAFKRTIKNNNNLLIGQEKMVVKGENGVFKTIFKNKIENGCVVEQTKLKEETIKHAVDEVLEKGTKTKTFVSSFRKKTPQGLTGQLTGFATNYNSGSVTSTGNRPKKGTIAADPSQIPYGAKVDVFSKSGKLIYSGVMEDFCPTAVQKKRGVVVDLYGVNIGRVPVVVKWQT